ncbi:branched-chain amino acid ABC transporter permease [Allopusillimonas ginsengisoli]|uniref:branched-chain amino acid ABC transporter permease n=1 Tax=Allopusillimonas ginsengisoli TaxID=453575 RepID=UPI001021D0CF|nr:branched-chain amino acid ABC transporter permease [Allopusillimonas ginsengisoli]TEA79007.1 branched-chain amino acid ABC transporter permease [Allopusillimonas ginsengisoli]
MMIDLFVNTLISGLLLGGFYALATLGLTLSFGMLDVVNIAQPAVMVCAAILTQAAATRFGLDPFLCGLFVLIGFFFIGKYFYRQYFKVFEVKRSGSIEALALFFALLFLLETGLAMIFGPERRQINTAWYVSTTLQIGRFSLPMRLLIPFVAATILGGGMIAFLRHTFIGRAVAAVGQDKLAVRFVGIDPLRIRSFAFGLSLALGAFAGICLLLIQPVDPWAGHTYLGRMFSICILGGLASVRGTWVAAVVFGVLENFTATYVGPEWSLCVAFVLLLVTLVIRPQGLFAR